MAANVMEYFKTCNDEINIRERSRIGKQLARGGITDMNKLCALLKYAPEQVAAIRNIGPHSMAIVEKVCAAFQQPRDEFTTLIVRQ